ncbi:MAG: hypothetical protein ACRD1R_11980 [Acidobacteriota bacterium]
MNTWEKWTFHISAVLVSLTGVAYLWMKYLLEGSDPFSVINHPWQPFFLHLHIVAAPFLLFIVGVLFPSHILGKLGKTKVPNRRSGWVTLISFPIMAVSGYLLQVVNHPLLLQMTLLLHLAGGGLFVVSYAIHQVVSVRLLKAAYGRKAGDGWQVTGGR